MRFDAAVPAVALEDRPAPLTLELSEGGFHVILTPPGLTGAPPRWIGGLGAPAEGRVEVLGEEPRRLSRRALLRFRRRLGVAVAPYALVSNLPLRTNMLVPLLYRGTARLEEAADRADTWLGAAGLSRWADRRPAEVPADARKQAAIVRAAVDAPELLVLEDPIAGMREARAEALLVRCLAHARTVVVTTDEPDPLLERLADAVIVWDEHGVKRLEDEVGIG